MTLCVCAHCRPFHLRRVVWYTSCVYLMCVSHPSVDSWLLIPALIFRCLILLSYPKKCMHYTDKSEIWLTFQTSALYLGSKKKLSTFHWWKNVSTWPCLLKYYLLGISCILILTHCFFWRGKCFWWFSFTFQFCTQCFYCFALFFHA